MGDMLNDIYFCIDRIEYETHTMRHTLRIIKCFLSLMLIVGMPLHALSADKISTPPADLLSVLDNLLAFSKQTAM